MVERARINSNPKYSSAMNTTGQGRISSKGEGDLILWPAGEVSAEQTESSPGCTECRGCGVGVERHPTEGATQQADDIDDGKSLGTEPLLEGDTNQRRMITLPKTCIMSP